MNAKPGLVSIVIPSYNARQYVGDAVDSALAQTYEPCEVIVVDDGSTDGTGEFLKGKYGGRIDYIHQKNKGLSGARNTGMRHARGEYIAFLDADDIFLPGKMERQVAHLVSHPNCDASYCGIYHFYEETPEKLMDLAYTHYSSKEVFPHLLVKNFINPLSVVLRRSAVDRYGFFNEAMRRSEDWDYWIRLAWRGAIFCFLGEPLAKYRMRKNSMSYAWSSEVHRKATTLDIFKRLRAAMTAEDRKKYGINAIIFMHTLKLWYAQAAVYVVPLRYLHDWFQTRRLTPVTEGPSYVLRPHKEPHPRVSIVMPTYNRAEIIGKAIQSVFDQSFSDWELIIIDDASTDATPEVLRRLAGSDRRVKILRNEKNYHPDIARTLNRGLKETRGEFIARLDDDDYWLDRDKLRKQLAFFDTHPEYVAAGTGVVVVDPNGNERTRYLKKETDEEIRKTALLASPFSHTTVMFRADVAREVGGYEWTFAEDWDLWLKMGKVGKLYNLPEHLAAYTMSGENKSFVYLRPQTKMIFQFLKRHRGAYPGFWRAYAVNLAQYVYSFLPLAVRRPMQSFLVSLKRRAF